MKHEKEGWVAVLVHRSNYEVLPIIDRLEQAGASPEVLAEVLDDRGDSLLHALARAGADPNWAEPYGGVEAVALLATELESFCAYTQRRAARLRSSAFTAFAHESELSLADIGRRWGISRQAVAKATSRPGMLDDFAHTLLRSRL